MSDESKELVKNDQGNQAVALASEYGDYAGVGYEGTTQEDYSIAFLNVLQALSPQVNGEAAIDGAKAGQLFNTVTEEPIDGKTGIEFIPAFREQVFVEWVPRDSGGGFVARHAIGSEVVNRAKAQADPKNPNKLQTESGNDLIQTAYIYGVQAHPDGRLEPLVLSFTSTKLKVYRHLMTKLNQFTVPVTIDGELRKITPPIFAYRLRVTTSPEKNNKGSFFNIKITPSEETLGESLLSKDDERFQAAFKLRGMIESGAAQANYDGQGGDDSSGTDNVPF